MKKQRAVLTEGETEGGGQATIAPPQDAALAPTAPAEAEGVDQDGGGWDQDERGFFARGAALESGESAATHDEDGWHGESPGLLRRLTLAKAAALSACVILAGLWLLGG